MYGGGIKRYLVTRLDYGSGFEDSLMDSSLVDLMLVEKPDSLPLGLAHDGWVLYCIWDLFILALRRGIAMEAISKL